MSDDTVEGLRARITEIDVSILGLINDRLEIVAELVRHKRANDIPLRDPGREEWLQSHLASVNAGPLSAEGVERLSAFILELTKQEAIDV